MLVMNYDGFYFDLSMRYEVVKQFLMNARKVQRMQILGHRNTDHTRRRIPLFEL